MTELSDKLDKSAKGAMGKGKAVEDVKDDEVEEMHTEKANATSVGDYFRARRVAERFAQPWMLVLIRFC